MQRHLPLIFLVNYYCLVLFPGGDLAVSATKSELKKKDESVNETGSQDISRLAKNDSLLFP